MSIKTRRPINYLNNRDLLKEIHLSKNSYSSFVQPEYNFFDIIADKPEEPLENSFTWLLEEEQLALAKKKRAARLTLQTGEKVDPETIQTEDLIFRVMTWEHIPLSVKPPKKNAKKKSAKEIFFLEEDTEVDDLFAEVEDVETIAEVDDMVHTRVNFPPFQHYKLDIDTNTLRCVGKSHWLGGMENGYFSKDHGQLTNKLAKMYIMLCEKYATRFNWRGYSYNDEMKCCAIFQLTYVGLRFNEAKSENPFAYYSQAVKNSFRRVLNTEKRSQNIRDDILEINNLTPSFARQARISDD